MMESIVKDTLKSLCCGYGWSYGALWQFDQQNSMFLTLAEAYEDRISGSNLIDEMLLQVHILGQGIVGEAAFSGKDRWIYSDALDESFMGSVSCQDNEVGAELRSQLAFGIKTVVAIPLKWHGVVQFGSTKKICMSESLEFLEQTKKLLLEKINIQQANASTPFLFENYGSDEWVDLLFSNEMSACKDQMPMPSCRSEKLTGDISDSLNITHPRDSVSKVHHEIMDRISIDPGVVFSEVASLEQLFLPETIPNSPFVFPPLQQDSHTASVYNIEELFDTGNFTRVNSGLLEREQHEDGMKSNLEISKWQATQSNQCPVAPLDSMPHDGTVASKDEFYIPSCASTSSSLIQGGSKTPVNNLAHLVQGNITDTFSHYTPAKRNNQFPCLASDYSDRKEVTPRLQSCVSGISELDAVCVSKPRNGLFSELGLEQLLKGTVQNSVPVDRSGFDDPYSTSKKRKVGCSSISVNHSQSEVISCLSDKVSVFHQNHQKATKTENLGLGSDFMLKSQAGLCIDDRYSINVRSTGANYTQATRTQESAKPVKKRARPGESTRPRPKDRQLFQDRLGELRKMIPNTGKCSIDALLDCTIKHMLFLQNVTQYSGKLKQIADHKEKGSISKNNANGVTWAFEMCDQAQTCPIKVEDVGSSAQMLVEMLCENGVTFLEIADTIRGLGLCILNGSMEDRNDKTWAHFIVETEASRAVARVDVFWSLTQHLQHSTTTSRINSINQLPAEVTC